MALLEAQFLRETVAPVHERTKGTRWNGLAPHALSTEDNANLLDQYMTRRIGLNIFRYYTLFKMLASRVCPVGLAVIPCHKFTYSICCLAVFVQLCFGTHISIASSF
jgi:hypothetical protein